MARAARRFPLRQIGQPRFGRERRRQSGVRAVRQQYHFGTVRAPACRRPHGLDQAHRLGMGVNPDDDTQAHSSYGVLAGSPVRHQFVT